MGGAKWQSFKWQRLRTIARSSRVHLARAEQILMVPGRTSYSDKSRLADLLTILRVFERVKWDGKGWRREKGSCSWDIGVTREVEHIPGSTRAFYSFACPATCLLLDSLVDYERAGARAWQPAHGWLEYTHRKTTTSLSACMQANILPGYSRYVGHVAAPKRMTSCIAVNHNKCARSEQSV